LQEDLRGGKRGVHLHPLLKDKYVLWQTSKAILARVYNDFDRKKKKLKINLETGN
jgi:hypothetical protein